MPIRKKGDDTKKYASGPIAKDEVQSKKIAKLRKESKKIIKDIYGKKRL